VERGDCAHHLRRDVHGRTGRRAQAALQRGRKVGRAAVKQRGAVGQAPAGHVARASRRAAAGQQLQPHALAAVGLHRLPRGAREQR